MPVVEQTEVAAPIRRGLPASLLYLFTVVFLFGLLFLRRPDALLTPQFFAEDGRIFFHDQFLYGGKEALLIPYGGYVLFIQRMVAMLGSLDPVVDQPLIYNGAALILAALCCSIFALPAFRSVIKSDVLRVVVCAIAAVGLDSAELVGTITQSQWYLQLAGILLLFYSMRPDAPRNVARDVFLAALLLLLALSVPMLILVVPFALWALVRLRGTRWLPAVALMMGVGAQLGVYTMAGIARGQSSLFSFHGLISSVALYLAFRAIVSAVIGRPEAMTLCADRAILTAILTGAIVIPWLVWLWRKSDRLTRRNILLCLYFSLSSAVLSVGARNLPRFPITFGGERYFYLSACCTVLLAAITVERIPWKLWGRAAALVAVFAAGIWFNFEVPAYADMLWPTYSRQIEHWDRQIESGKATATLNIPTNPPGWSFLLEGDVLTNGDFESVYALPWMSSGTLHTALSNQYCFAGKACLAMAGADGARSEGDVRQLVRELKPGTAMRAQVMALESCVAGLQVSLEIQDGHRRVGYTGADPKLCGHWQQLTVPFRVAPNGRAMLILGYRGSSQIVLWDDAQLQPQ